MLSDRKEKLVLCHNSESGSGTTQLIDTVYLVPQKMSHPVLETKPSANHVCARISLTTYTA